ncbi:hypothetical protein [Acidithiobacillus thiooxidans]|uniref:Uncharacterized protein n=1 Tax=Acidithiobacillus thiooxidans ATCC 19377 TaxID=637390 RepID=A0A543Q778_ACITH|nr:hypothetical protein [Acidithiobacillus thiooxidans]MDX5933599.1 hypothetical protein [Acidithiobacillus thiooxidans]TQN52186.1 hypothetical protein DLNHIDIE_02070 [Acidithiobacillus thiooxidans ATCC 19377]
MNSKNHKKTEESFSTFVELSPEDGQILLNFGISETDWKALIDYRGNKTKAFAWVESRLQEVRTLSSEAQRSYLRVMLNNLMYSDKQ